MKYFFAISLVLFCTLHISAQHYEVNIDLTQVIDDKVPVEIVFSGFNLTEPIEFQMPKMVPGTYSISDFGRALSDVKAFDSVGTELQVSRIDDNRWKIEQALTLYKISYWVDDTFDEEEFSDVFEPGGTNIQEDLNYVINTFGFIGYLDNLADFPFQIKIIHPDFLYGASPMNREIVSSNEEIFSADNYFQLTDSPIMYAEPDTASVMIGNTRVMISVYSPGKKTDANFIMEKVEPTLKSAGEFLGGNLPVDNYLIMVYLLDKPSNSGAYGALEHSYSTVFVLPSRKGEFLSQTIVDVTAHEFFHIITPLTIHSEEIGNYDFINPKMSKHLWLYEGVTEYSSMHMQVMYGLVTPDEFLEVILDKMEGASKFNDSLPFTEMSLGALYQHKNQYANVYEKGALIGMCLDLKLLELSDGKSGIRELLETLSETYGIEKSFDDDKLFDEITALTYPEIREFFARYVAGAEPLPYSEYLGYAGVFFQNGGIEKINTLGSIGLGMDEERGLLVISDTDNMDDFGKKIGFKKDDYLISINKDKLTAENYSEVFTNFLSMEEGRKITVVVQRKNKKGVVVEKKLKGRVTTIRKEVGREISWETNPTEKQLKIRKSWLNQE